MIPRVVFQGRLRRTSPLKAPTYPTQGHRISIAKL